MNEESTNASRAAVPTTLYERQVLLAFMPPSQRQQRMALACVLVMAVLFVATAPFISTQLPQINAFIPIIATAIFTASWLFVQYAASGALELLILAGGYLFTAANRCFTCAHLSWSICADGPPRRGVANYCLALYYLALRICSFRDWLRGVQAGRSREDL
jgi:hypothetical protein